MKLILRNERAQTSVEYIFMLVVVLTIIFSLMGMVRNFLITESGECTPSDQALVCKLQRSFTPSNDYKYFRLLR